MDALDIAHPTLTLALVVALLVTLGLLNVINRRLSVAEHRLESLEREQRLYDEALALVGTPVALPAPTELPSSVHPNLIEQIAEAQRDS